MWLRSFFIWDYHSLKIVELYTVNNLFIKIDTLFFYFILHLTVPAIYSLFVHLLFIWNIFLPNPTTPAIFKSRFHNLIFTFSPTAILKVRDNNQKCI